MLMSMMVGRRWIDRTGVCDADGYSGKVGDDGMVIMIMLRMMVLMKWIIVILLGMMMLVFVLMIPPTTAQPILQI